MGTTRLEHGVPWPCPGASLGHLGSAVSFTDGGGSSAQGLKYGDWGQSSQIALPSWPSFTLYFPPGVLTGQAGGLGVHALLCAPARVMCGSRAAPACWEFSSSLPELHFLMCARGLTISVPGLLDSVALDGTSPGTKEEHPGWLGILFAFKRSDSQDLRVCGECGVTEVSMSSISLQRKHLQGLDPREPTGPRVDTPLPGGTGSGWERAPVK